jgi:hypothetical protein
MSRLGLWGLGTQFEGFGDFAAAMSKRGVGALEMLSIEMKASGTFVSRALGFSSAVFSTVEAELRPEDIRAYDQAVAFWDKLKAKLAAAIAETNAKNTIMRMFWSAHQRFFKSLCICALFSFGLCPSRASGTVILYPLSHSVVCAAIKVPEIARQAQEAIEAGQCAVIGLQTTGESALDEHLKQTGGLGRTFPKFISSTQFILTSFISNHFPCEGVVGPDPSLAAYAGGSLGALGDSLSQQPHTAAEPTQRIQQPEPLPHLVHLRNELLKEAKQLVLPPSPLDDLIDRLGGPSMVAEMTGRKGRLVRVRSDSDPVTYELRANTEEERESLNVMECRRFQAGERFVAIISDAASTGISLHASLRAGNQRRRVHITMEMPWSADKAIQQLGRSHRSGQASSPDYRLVISALAGERRFAAAVARRLESLGALTRGDRRAATGADLSQFNFETKYGKAALKKLITWVAYHHDTPPGVELEPIVKGTSLEGFGVGDLHAQLNRVLKSIGLLDEAGAKVPVSKFLNRLLGAPVEMQNMIFTYYTAIFDADVQAAKRTGTYNEGVSDIRGRVTAVQPPRVIYKNQSLGIETVLHTLAVDRGMAWEEALAQLQGALAAEATARAENSDRSSHARADEMDDFIVPDEETDDDRLGDDDEGDDAHGGSRHAASSRTGFYRSREKVFGSYIHVLCIEKKVGWRTKAVQTRPNTGTKKAEVFWDDVDRTTSSLIHA